MVYGVDQACQMTVMVDAKAELFTVRLYSMSLQNYLFSLSMNISGLSVLGIWHRSFLSDAVCGIFILQRRPTLLHISSFLILSL